MDELKRQSMIAYLRRRMDEFGIHLEDIEAALAEDARTHAMARYYSPNGDTWDGNGKMPQWLRQAINAGQSLEHFAKEQGRPIEEPAPKQADWSQDPFAGSRLARVNL